VATTPNGITYPAETDSGDVAYWMGQMAGSIDPLLVPASAGFTSFAWTASTTNPAIGNGTYEARYIKDGHRVGGQAVIGIGSGTTMGSGSYFWTLPAFADVNMPVGHCVGQLSIKHGGVYAQRSLLLSTSTSVFAVDAAGVVMTSAVPFALVNGDVLMLTFDYLAA
jgi:hypothetical protein